MPLTSAWKRLNAAVKCFFVLAPLAGLGGTVLSAEIGDLAFSLFGAACLTAWCEVDSRHRDARISRWFGLGIFLLAIVFFPLYLLRSRGPKGLLLLLPAVLVLALGIVLAVAAEELVLFFRS
jgi:hypothetical protein